MAALRQRCSLWLLTILMFCLYWNPAGSVRTKTKIYIDLKTQSACFRTFNGTHQMGCASSQSGNVGIVYYIQKSEDFDWILNDGPHAPYIVVMDTKDFIGDNVRRLYKRSDRVTGIMVISLPPKNDNSSSWPQDGFSISDSCPNDQAGLYRDSKVYGGCKKTKWNLPGSGLIREDLGIPVFALSDESDVDKILKKCFFKFNERDNGSSRGYPLCAAELKIQMFGAVDTEVCLRRSNQAFSLLPGSIICDPMGDKNNHVTMMNTPQNETRANDSVIIVGARMDSTALFTLEYRSSDTCVSGFVTLLAAMEALWRVKNMIRNTAGAKDIMFAFFHGESYDYIGSSSMVYSMQQGTFPQDLNSDRDDLHLHNIDLQHIHQFVELNQVGYRDKGSLWMHTDPDNRRAKQAQIKNMIDGLKAATQGLNVSLQEADQTQPLPPASSQRFLMERADIPVVVVTDHQAEYTNKFYNSRLDLAEFINATDYPPGLTEAEKYDFVTTQAEMISELATALARYLYEASTGVAPDPNVKDTLTANTSTVTHMLYCFLVSPNCELLKEIVPHYNSESLETALLPYPFYVGIHGDQSQISALIYNLMARFTGELVDLDESHCKTDDHDKRYSYLYVQGNKVGSGKDRQGWCIKSLVQDSDAYSPAFQIDDYDWKSGKYSTWSESRWAKDSLKVRLFLVPSPHLQLLTLLSGLVVLLLSMIITYLIAKRSGEIFQQQQPSEQQPTSG
ncbi:hypothetical protein RRG08_008497 [Elysia crispata]|uniref:Nicastrin n=1 Tax=Elysia crispata TaxID=231223 RepID=A0AAE0Z8A2_9GAST|nr:hypothetical protein RRG08_008497 [Elysia crispata]